MQSDIPVRRNYLRYIVEEWFEDTLLEKIKSGLGRNDISIDDFSEHPKKSQVCVPPVSKPEEVTDDEMIDFIVKNRMKNYNPCNRYKRKLEADRINQMRFT